MQSSLIGHRHLSSNALDQPQHAEEANGFGQACQPESYLTRHDEAKPICVLIDYASHCRQRRHMQVWRTKLCPYQSSTLKLTGSSRCHRATKHQTGSYPHACHSARGRYTVLARDLAGKHLFLNRNLASLARSSLKGETVIAVPVKMTRPADELRDFMAALMGAISLR